MTRSGGFIVAAAVVALGFGTADAQTSSNPSANQKQTLEKTKSAFDEAQKAQADAKNKLEAAGKADENVASKREELKTEEQKAQKARQDAQQAQQQATEKAKAAEQASTQAQQQGAQAQQQTEQQLQQKDNQSNQQAAVQSASGDIASASPNEIVVQQPGKAPLHMSVGSDTEVTIDGKPSSPQNLQPGQQVNISFKRVGGQTVAQRIDGRTTM